MKTLLDRMNSLYPKDYRFRDVYLLSAAAEDGDYTPKRASSACRVGSTALKMRNSKERLFVDGINDPNDINENEKLNKAYEMGERV